MFFFCPFGWNSGDPSVRGEDLVYNREIGQFLPDKLDVGRRMFSFAKKERHVLEQ